MFPRLQDGQIRLGVELNRRQIDHSIHVGLRQHLSIIGEAPGNAKAVGHLVQAIRRFAADGDDLGAVGQAMEFWQIVALGHIAATQKSEFEHG